MKNNETILVQKIPDHPMSSTSTQDLLVDPNLISSISNNELKPDAFIEPCGGILGYYSGLFRRKAKNFLSNFKNVVLRLGQVFFFLIIIIYIGFVIKTFVDTGFYIDWCTGYGMAFMLIGLLIISIVYNTLNKYKYFNMFHFNCDNGFGLLFKKYGRCTTAAVFLLLFFGFVIYDTVVTDELNRIMSLLGIVAFLLCGLVFSKHPEYIRWDTILVGLSLQMFLGLISIPIKFGREIFSCIGDRVVHFLSYAYTGAAFVFGDFLVNKQHVFAFQALSVLYFLSMIVQVLYYLGWMQIICLKIGKSIQFVLGTTVIESVNAVATVFLGMSEAPLLYNVYIKYLTNSEIHAVMTGCFATVAGTMLAAYTSLGIDPKNVITASIMAAPGALTYAKLYYPETVKSSTSKNILLVQSDDVSVMDAACKGTFMATTIVSSIIASVIASVSFINLLDGIILWLGYLVGIENLTLDYILGIIFIPLAWAMGVKHEECELVASLIGIKTIANEFIAYVKLSELKSAGKLSARSEAIATFALCGFANPGALATMIAFLSSLAPSKRESIINVSFRAFVTGCITSFSSACIAGLLTPENGF
ncbi:solute carrier family 28 member 3-like [Cimex lectularius]|uniref:Sodium/nucleoside cotransporter n=1 Tax=Cimex lectularius TaxID=79782 RepID=A0A8I6SQ12_CIMLE|nr:solute carrier family 28 member 3-like [Cimex lectularius]XP_024084807.1 solute carrier family 28 member 3-like [Cimex lectularius]